MDFLFNYMDIIFFIIIATIKLLIFGNQTSDGSFSNLHILVPCIASVLLLASVTCLFTKKKRAKLLYTFNLIISISLIADLNYFRYFKDLVSIPVLKNGFQLTAVGSSVNSVFKIKDLLYVLDLIFFIPVIDYYKYKKAVDYTFRQKFIQFSCIFIVGSMVNFGSIYSLAKEQPRLITTMFNRIYVANSIGDVNYHLIDAYNSLRSDIVKHVPVSEQKEEDIKTFFQTNSSETYNLKGATKGKNLIIIQVEALQNFVINSKVEGNDITPNLNKWINKSVYFNNYFYQISSGGTSDAEFISNNSLYPASSGSAYYLYSGNDYDSLGIELKNSGYNTNVFHGYKESFWNRNVMYPKEGFDTFYGEKSYNIDEKIGLGLSDQSFLNQSLDKMKELKKPYYSFLITLSSHYPYDDLKGYGEFNTGKYEDTLLGNYLKGIHYTDAQLGMFLDNLEKEGMLKDSVVVIYGDHYAIPKENENELATFLNCNNMNELTWMQQQKVPLIIHFPDEQYKGTNNIYAGQMDLYPTLSNLFDLKANNMMGKDLFNSKNGNVFFRNGSFTDGNIFYLSESNTYYDVKSENIINETPSMQDKKEKVLTELQYSDILLNHNLLKKFNEEK